MEDFVAVGKVLDTFRLEGELKVLPYLPPEEFLKLKRVFFKKRGGDFVPFEVESVKEHGKYLVLKLKGYDDAESASQFKGAKLFLPRSELPPLGEDEFYAYQLVGMNVITDKGRELGKVVRVRDMGPYEALVLEGEKLFIPFVSEIVLSVDSRKGEVKVKEDLLPL